MTRKIEPTGLCAQCSSACNPDRMGLCATCRLRLHNRCQFPWSAEKDAKLVRAYQAAQSRTHLTESLSQLAAEFKFPRNVLMRRAASLGMQFIKKRDWTPQEIQFLQENSGSLTVKKMAKELHRSEQSVRCCIFRMDLSGKIEEGYTQKGLADLIGVSGYQIAAWVRRGLLELSNDIADRITHESVRHFLLFHIDQYSLRRVEEWWMKMLVKEELELGRRPAAKSQGEWDRVA